MSEAGPSAEVPRFSVLIPTRDRPRQLERMFASLIETTEDLAAVEVVLYFDEDDPTRDEPLIPDEVAVRRIVGPRRTMGDYNAACLEAARGEVLLTGNDDMVFRTHGWDRLVWDFHRSIPDGVYLAYGDDLLKGRGLCTFPIMSRRACEALAAPFPASYIGQLIDYHLLDVFKRLEAAGHDRIHFLRELVLEHLHYRAGKSEFDQTYEGRKRFADDTNFLELRAFRQAEAERLLACIEAGRAAPEIEPPPARVEPTAAGFLGTAWSYLAGFLADRALPLKWRSFLFVFFVARDLRNRGFLRWSDYRPGVVRVVGH